MMTDDEEQLTVYKVTYTLTLGELDFEDLSPSRFIIFVAYTTFITLVLMNLLIAILSDAYELVQSEKKYYEGKAQLEKSLMFERLVVFFMKLKEKKEQTYHYLFISMPLSFEDDTNNEDEGMIGKIVNVARTNHKENQNAIHENHKEI